MDVYRMCIGDTPERIVVTHVAFHQCTVCPYLDLVELLGFKGTSSDTTWIRTSLRPIYLRLSQSISQHSYNSLTTSHTLCIESWEQIKGMYRNQQKRCFLVVGHYL
jgi:hypothetical protein